MLYEVITPEKTVAVSFLMKLLRSQLSSKNMDPLIEKQLLKWGLSKQRLPTELCEWEQFLSVITSYSIHYTKLYDSV